MFVLAFSFVAFAFTAYCAFSERNEGKKDFYMVLLVIMALMVAINFVKVVV